MLQHSRGLVRLIGPSIVIRRRQNVPSCALPPALISVAQGPNWFDMRWFLSEKCTWPEGPWFSQPRAPPWEEVDALHFVFGPTAPWFARGTGWPVGPTNARSSLVPPFPRAVPWAGRTDGPLVCTICQAGGDGGGMDGGRLRGVIDHLHQRLGVVGRRMTATGHRQLIAGQFPLQPATLRAGLSGPGREYRIWQVGWTLCLFGRTLFVISPTPTCRRTRVATRRRANPTMIVTLWRGGEWSSTNSAIATSPTPGCWRPWAVWPVTALCPPNRGMRPTKTIRCRSGWTRRFRSRTSWR